jgi:hypothetical protein
LVALVIVALLAVAPTASANGADFVGTAAFLDIGMGARPLGMGGAFTAVADDANALYYNPAGLASLDGFQMTSMYTSLWSEVTYLGIGVTYKNMGLGTLRLSAINQGTDEYGNPTEPFDYADLAVMGSYAVALGKVSLGGTVKYYSQTLPDNPGSGFTGDLGILVDLAPVRFGVVAKNLIGNVTYQSGTTDPFDRKFVVGAAANLFGKLTVAGDYDTSGMGHVGAEFAVTSFLSVRAGAMVGTEGETGFSLGAGVNFKNFKLDYAYQTHNDLPDNHWVSLGMTF